MYPPRKNDSTSKSKNNNQGTASSPPHKDISKVTKLLENAKKYEQTNKRDYMLQGIMNIKKKQSDHEPLGGKNKESQISSRGSEKQQDNKWDIYRKNGPNPGREVQRLNNYRSSENLHSNQSDTYRNQGPMARESDRSSDAKIGNQLSSKQSSQAINYLNKYTNIKETLGNSGNIGNAQRSSNIGPEQNYSAKYETNYNKILEDNSPRPVSPTYSNQPQPYQTRSNYYAQPKKPQTISNILNNFPRGQVGSVENKTSIVQNTSNSNSNYNNSSTNQNLKIQSRGSQAEKRKSPNMQSQIEEIISQNNAVRIQSEKRQANTTNNDMQTYLKRVESGQVQEEQIKFIRKQMEKISSEANQIRQKYYKAENQRSSLSQKCQIYENLNNQLRKQNEKLKLQNKNYQIQLKNLQHFKQQLQNQVRELRDNKQYISLEMSKKNNDLTVEMRKKTTEISKLQRFCSELEQQMSGKSYQIEKLQSQNKRKQEYIQKIKQKQNELGSLHQANNNIEFQLKSALQKLQLLEGENKNLRQRNIEDQKYQTEKSKYRKQIQQMLEDMRDLQIQLEQKETVINQYKNFSYKQSQNSQIKQLEAQYQKLLKQKSQMGKAYEQKLLQKDKKISQLQIKEYEKSSGQGLRLGGLEAGDAAFQVILKQQLQQVNALKRELTGKVGQIFHFKIQIQNLKSQVQSQKNKYKMLSMQIEANQRNGQASNDSHLKAAKSQIQSLNRRVQNMNQTIEAKRKQNQNKDQFIKRYIIGTNKQANASVLMSNLEKMLNQKG